MRNKVSLVLLVFWPVLASVISFFISANFFVSTLLFLLAPSIYLSWLNRKSIGKISIFSLVFGIPISVVLDYVMEVTGGWYVPYSIFGSFRLFDLVTVDLVLWGILEAYFILMFYETFLDRKYRHEFSNPNLKYLYTFLYICLGVFIWLFVAKPGALEINYFYLKLGVVMVIIPIASAVLKFPKLWNRLLNIAAYFFLFNLVYEFTAVRLGQWSFPAKDQLIGMVEIWGAQIAFEEFFFWIMLTAMAVVSFYELFDDDGK